MYIDSLQAKKKGYHQYLDFIYQSWNFLYLLPQLLWNNVLCRSSGRLSEEAFHSEYKEKDLKFCGGLLYATVVIGLLDFIL